MDFSLVFVVLVGAVAAVYLFRALADYDRESSPHEDEGQEQVEPSQSPHQGAPLKELRKTSRALDESGSAFRPFQALNLARILREHKAKKKLFQKNQDDWVALEKEFHSGPVENRSNVLKSMQKLTDKMVADIGMTHDEVDARIAARLKAGKVDHSAGFIDTTPLDGYDRKDLARFARQLGLKARGTDDTLKRNIAAEQSRLRERHAAEPERLDDVAIGLWKSFANTSTGIRLGGWWAKFLRDE
jgi:hypothetical protein